MTSYPSLVFIDFLEVLCILTRVNCRDKRMQDAIDLLIGKQNENGRWIVDETYYGRLQVNLEKRVKKASGLP